MDIQITNVSVGIDEIIPYLITLFAVAPSVIIAVMFNFLSTIEIEISKLVKNENGKENKYSANVKAFTILSSKFLHLTMSYYLLLLFSSLAIRSFLPDSYTFWAMIAATVIYIIYAMFYINMDLRFSLKVLDKYKDAKYINTSFIHNILIFYIAFIIIPIVFQIPFYFKQNPITIHLSWITLSMLYLTFWWLKYPFQYSPLSNIGKYLSNSEND